MDSLSGSYNSYIRQTGDGEHVNGTEGSYSAAAEGRPLERGSEFAQEALARSIDDLGVGEWPHVAEAGKSDNLDLRENREQDPRHGVCRLG